MDSISNSDSCNITNFITFGYKRMFTQKLINKLKFKIYEKFN